MTKKWYDAGLITDREDIPKELYKYDSMMKEKPNWNKKEVGENKKRKNKKKFKYKR